VDRRRFLGVAGGTLAALWLPTVRKSPLAPEQLHRRAQQAAASARTRGPAATLREASDLLTLAETATFLAPLTASRRSLHRTASLAALTAAQAAQRAQRPAAGDYVKRADAHAHQAGDGPLQAQALMLRRDQDGEAGHMLGVGSDRSIRLLTEALDRAGAGRSSASLRAAIFYRLAWERAALGDQRGARLELQGADISAELAIEAPDFLEDEDLRGGGGVARRGSVLRHAGCHDEAETAISEALSTGAGSAGVAHHHLGCLRAAQGDVDGAAAALEEGFLTARAGGNIQAARYIRATAQTLPVSTVTQGLRELLA
jgi:tetratricopeptide (TPR) repeat protein